LSVAAGCVTPRHYPPPNLAPTARLIPVEPQPERPTLPPITPVAHIDTSKPRTVLAISGGGLYGAYAAGVLNGWTDAGIRPAFDVVTGISTGALIAPLAFLGAEYDDLLKDWYTTIRPNDIYRRRWLPALLWSDSVADSSPLRQRIDAVVTPEFLDRIAAAHNAGRRLYVGTTDLDTKKLVVWDLGAIAAGPDPDKLAVFRKVLLASCAIPGVMPPVAIDIEVNGHRRTELHVDGGVGASVFVPPVAMPAGTSNTTVYVIVSGKVMAEAHPVPQRFIDVSAESLNGLLRSQVRADLLRIALQARRSGAGFGFAAVPDEFEQAQNSIDISPKMMTRLFDEGYKFSRGGLPWHPTPPGLDADAPPPRTGTIFTVIDPNPRASSPKPAAVEK
jgi:predicted acylesterase/phospholipase RssA